MSTPPTVPHVHDSDRKAAEEINSYEILCARHNLRCDLNENALIIARHHAEERAAVEKVKDALEGLLACDDRGELHRDPLDTGVEFQKARAALTALRTASQSPTEGKT